MQSFQKGGTGLKTNITYHLNQIRLKPDFFVFKEKESR